MVMEGSLHTVLITLPWAGAPTRCYYPGASPCGFVENLIKVIKHQLQSGWTCAWSLQIWHLLPGAQRPSPFARPLPLSLPLWPASIYTSLGLSPSAQH